MHSKKVESIRTTIDLLIKDINSVYLRRGEILKSNGLINWLGTAKNIMAKLEHLREESAGSRRGINTALEITNQLVLRSLEVLNEISANLEKLRLFMKEVINWKFEMKLLLEEVRGKIIGSIEIGYIRSQKK
jgi:hypothetical protein